MDYLLAVASKLGVGFVGFVLLYKKLHQMILLQFGGNDFALKNYAIKYDRKIFIFLLNILWIQSCFMITNYKKLKANINLNPNHKLNSNEIFHFKQFKKKLINLVSISENQYGCSSS